MKKTIFSLLAATLLTMSFLLTGCSNVGNDADNGVKDTGKAVEDGAKDVGDDVKEGAEKVGEGVKDGVEKVGEYVTIAIDDVKKMVDEGADYTMIDLRDEAAYNTGHIKGAVSVKAEEIEERAKADFPDKDKKIVIYDEDGKKSKETAQKLIDMGYTNVYDMGAFSGWTYDTTTEMPAGKTE